MSDVNEKVVILLGAGGHAKVVADALLKSGKTILGLIAPDKEVGTECFGVKVLGDDEVLLSYSPNEVVLANGIGVLPHQLRRWHLAQQMRDKGYIFTQVIHPSAIISGDVGLAEGVQVMAGAIIQAGSNIGQDSIVNTNVSIDHDCTICENCHLAPGVTISGGVSVAEGVHLGTGTVVIENISIGKNSIVAAGSVVFKKLLDNTMLIQTKQNVFK